jgi:YHS domain-containing protein
MNSKGNRTMKTHYQISNRNSLSSFSLIAIAVLLFGGAFVPASLNPLLAPCLAAEEKAHEHGDKDGHAHEAVQDEHDYLYANHTCPTCSDPIDPHLFAEVSNKKKNIYGRIYFCCADCGKKIKKDIGKYYMTLYRTDEKTGKEKPQREIKNQVCPVEGGKTDGKTAIEYNGMMVSFCCADCIAEFLKDPEKGMAKILPEAKEFKFEGGEEHGEHEEGHDHDHGGHKDVQK